MTQEQREATIAVATAVRRITRRHPSYGKAYDPQHNQHGCPVETATLRVPYEGGWIQRPIRFGDRLGEPRPLGFDREALLLRWALAVASASDTPAVLLDRSGNTYASAVWYYSRFVDSETGKHTGDPDELVVGVDLDNGGFHWSDGPLVSLVTALANTLAPTEDATND